MIDSRRWPSATPARASTQDPLSSGPRWCRTSAILLARAVSSSPDRVPEQSTNPAMPHTPDPPPLHPTDSTVRLTLAADFAR